MIRALAEWLITQPGLTDLVIGSTLWIGPMTEADLNDKNKPDRMVMLLERPGAAELQGDVGQSRLQVLVRENARNFWKGRDLALAVYRALHEVYSREFEHRNARNVATGDVEEVWAILADSLPAPIGYDPRGCIRFSMNFTIARTTA